MRRVLEGHADDLDRRLVERQQALVRALAFEQAARLENQREALERALRGVRRLRAAARDDVVLVQPAKRRGWVAIWGVRGGRIAVEREVGREAFGEPAALGMLADLAAADPPRPPYPAASIDEMLLVHSWTDAHRAAPNVIDLRAFVAGGEDARGRRRPRSLRAVRLASDEPAATRSRRRHGAATASHAPRRRPLGRPAPDEASGVRAALPRRAPFAQLRRLTPSRRRSSDSVLFGPRVPAPQHQHDQQDDDDDADGDGDPQSGAAAALAALVDEAVLGWMSRKFSLPAWPYGGNSTLPILLGDAS